MVANAISGNIMQNGDLGTTTGTNTIVATPSPPLAALTTGALYTCQFGGTNTGAATINVSGLGAVGLVKRASTALASGDALVGATGLMRYNGTNMQLLNPVVP
jgi:hypothetical protein